MKSQRGQASILIAIIFQILFIFFAMVVNVGLLVHDKINLQNSTDIAAYYGAMRQAEVMNAMAQTNYQIRQAYKLLVWRLWVLADAGRNSYMNQSPVPTAPPPEVPETWGSDKNKFPVICVVNNFWQNSPHSTLCKDSGLKIPAVQPLTLTPFQQVFFLPSLIFANNVKNDASKYNSFFKPPGRWDFQMAIAILSSYKIAVQKRRAVMKQLQDLLIKNPNDFSDISGSSVSSTITTTLKKNLTAANNAGLDTVEFVNGLGGAPFLVPIDVRVWMYYEDYAQTGSSWSGQPKALNDATPPDPATYNTSAEFWKPDYVGAAATETAQDFSQEPSDPSSNPKGYNSLVGFEKNPWVMAYVSVKATTHPKMLFSPFSSGGKSQITLSAESYAAPFGGKMGPWYADTWGPSASESTGNSIDGNLPPRMDVSQPPILPTGLQAPNYSRFPGDNLGMQSQLARFVELSKLYSSSYIPAFADYLKLSSEKADPLATGSTRLFETQAIQPDLFDAAYYSIDYDFPSRFGDKDKLMQSWCPNIPCYDLGNDFSSGASRISIETIMNGNGKKSTDAFWGIKMPGHLNTSWSQGDPGFFDAAQAQVSAAQRWENTDSSGKPAGGRAGYSVKLISKNFLLRTDLVLGGGTNGAPIKNPPQ